MFNKIRHLLHPIKRKLLYENKIVPALYLFCCKIHLVKPSIVVYVDGGICSQMHQYLLGRYYAEQGMKVSYNLGWYKRDGKDNDGLQPRIFELMKMWPEIDFTDAGGTSYFYGNYFPVQRDGMHFPLKITPPAYLHGYYEFDDGDLYRSIFQRYFRLDQLARIAKATSLDEWNGTKCALHVRRGDLARMDDYFYGKVSIDYFRSAITFIANKFKDVKFFVFSDGFDWVEKELSPYLSSFPYELVKGNLAYEDLNLMAHCDCFISSQGSAGKFAAMISGDGLLIVGDDPHDAVWKDRHPNTVVLNS